METKPYMFEEFARTTQQFGFFGVEIYRFEVRRNKHFYTFIIDPMNSEPINANVICDIVGNVSKVDVMKGTIFKKLLFSFI